MSSWDYMLADVSAEQADAREQNKLFAHTVIFVSGLILMGIFIIGVNCL